MIQGIQIKQVKEEEWYSERLKALDPALVPHHVALIPDGNRRWALARSERTDFGHFHGADRVQHIVRAAWQLGIKVLTLYTFSTENWSRSPEEVDTLFTLMVDTLNRLEPQMRAEGVRLEVIGDISGLPQTLQMQIQRTREVTKTGSAITLVLALNYGGRNEILRACQKAIESAQNPLEILSEATLSACLDTAPWGDPQLVIRTSGELRISNFLLWQTAYSEFYFSSKLWPDFTQHDLLEALLDYQKRIPRMGR